MITTPLILTLTRLIISPLLLPFLLVYLLPLNYLWLNSLLAACFVALSITDFFDGYIARKYNQVTVVGAVLDPVADKCLVMATVVSLVAIQKIYFLWAILFLSREFFLMALRHIALSYRFSVPVNWIGKVKTVAQMAYLVMVIITPYQHLPLRDALWWHTAEFVGLLAALFFTIYSAYHYANEFLRTFRALSEDYIEGEGNEV